MEKTVNKVYIKKLQLCYVLISEHQTGICAELLNSDTSSFCLMVHMFYLQANDIRQVYAFCFLHCVLVLTKMCKPAERKKKRK